MARRGFAAADLQHILPLPLMNRSEARAYATSCQREHCDRLNNVGCADDEASLLADSGELFRCRLRSYVAWRTAGSPPPDESRTPPQCISLVSDLSLSVAAAHAPFRAIGRHLEFARESWRHPDTATIESGFTRCTVDSRRPRAVYPPIRRAVHPLFEKLGKNGGDRELVALAQSLLAKLPTPYAAHPPSVES
eukprot:scaffold26351_cov64-Phaeocystis_antarctica.AAC.2